MSNPTELPDLDKLEALAKGAQISILRMGMNGRPNDYFALLSTMSPEAVLALIALARRAQPEGESLEGRIVSIDVSTGEHDAGNRIFAELTGETASDGTTLLAIEEQRNFGQPEGEAPQAAEAQVFFNGSWKPASAEAFYCMTEDKRRVVDRTAATLSPLCGAQHAESGKEPAGFDAWFEGHINRDLKKLERSVRRHHQLEAWKAALAAQQAAAPGSLDGWNAAAKALAERAAGHFRNKDFELQDECLQCASMLHEIKPARAATSVPGTPEAPKGGQL